MTEPMPRWLAVVDEDLNQSNYQRIRWYAHHVRRTLLFFSMALMGATFAVIVFALAITLSVESQPVEFLAFIVGTLLALAMAELVLLTIKNRYGKILELVATREQEFKPDEEITKEGS